MEVPVSVRHGVIALWASLGISAASALIAKLMGLTTEGEFAFVLVIYALFCVIPYKISNGSNAARYFYVVVSVLGLLFVAGGVGETNRVDFAVSIAMIPLEVFILFKLFQRESSAWFRQAR